MSKIVTPEFEELFKNYPLGSQAYEDNPVSVAKLHDEEFANIFFLWEYDPESGDCTTYHLELETVEERYICLDPDKDRDRYIRIWFSGEPRWFNIKDLEQHGFIRDCDFKPVRRSELITKETLGFENFKIRPRQK